MSAFPLPASTIVSAAAAENKEPNDLPEPHRAITITRKPVANSTTTPLAIEKPPAPLPARSRASTLWHRYSRRTRIIASTATLALLVLIVGLAAGLATRAAGTSNLPLPSAFGGPYTGDLTYYAPGLGACGIMSANGDSIVAVSHLVFDAVQTGANPNDNPLCGKTVRVRRKGGDVSVDLTVVDRCTGCAATDLDMTEDTFAELADVSLGRVVGEWSWLEHTPGGAKAG